jgi:hypothetical protein
MQFDEAIGISRSVLKENRRPRVHEKWEEVVRAMAVHIEGRYPAELIDKKRPNEPPEIKEFRKQNYSPITVSVFEEAMAGLFRIFNPDNYEIKVSPDLSLYVDGNNFSGTDFVSWAQQYMLPRMIIDPNAWVVVLPDGPVMQTNTGRINPRIELIPSDRIWATGSKYVMWLSEEVVPIASQGGTVNGKVYYLLTDEEYIRLEQVSTDTQTAYRADSLFRHNVGQLPALALGGIPHTTDGPHYFESWFRAAVPFGNEALKQYSDYYAMLTVAGSPVREMRPVECQAAGCNKGKVYPLDGGDPHNCRNCNGTGHVPDSSPYGIYIQSKDPMDGESRPPVIFHSPDIAPLEYGERAWAEMYRRMRQALHLDYVDEGQSGVAKMIDREPAYAQLLRISNHTWETLIWSLLYYMEGMRNWQAPGDIVVVKPTEFSLRTEADLVNELAQLRTSGAPNDLIIEVLRELIRKRYAGNDLLIRKHDFLIQTDPLYDSSDQSKAFYLNVGLVSAPVVAYNLWAGSILDSLIARTRPNPIELFNNPDELYRRIVAEITLRTPPPTPIPATA